MQLKRYHKDVTDDEVLSNMMGCPCKPTITVVRPTITRPRNNRPGTFKGVAYPARFLHPTKNTDRGRVEDAVNFFGGMGHRDNASKCS